jgi:hypothetical protein
MKRLVLIHLIIVFVVVVGAVTVQFIPAAAEDQETYSEWGLEVNSGCQYSDHDIYIDIDARPEDITDLSLIIHAWDVDFKGADWCPAGNEVDIVYINDNRLGYLTGANESWSVNIFPLDRDMINGVGGIVAAAGTSGSGSNHIHIQTDSKGTGCWCVGVGQVKIKGKVGFQIDTVTPKPDARNVDWENPGVSVSFTSPYEPGTVNNETFRLFYWGTKGKVYVPGVVEHTSLTMATFKATSGKLEDGVYFIAEIWGKRDAEAAGRSQWVKGPGGKDLEQGRTWPFWTMPDLTGKITVVPVQVARGSTLVPLKPAVIRVYAPWDKRDDVALNWQVAEIETKVSLEDENGNAMLSPQQWKFRRSDKYGTQEKIRGVTSTLFFGWTPPANFSGSHSIKAIVEPLGQASTPQRKFEGLGNFVVGSKSPSFSYEYRAVRVGAWEPPGTPPASFPTLIGNSNNFFSSAYPFVSVTSRSAGPIGPKLTSDWRPWVPDKNWAALYLYHLWQMTPGLDRMVGIVPAGWLGPGTLGGAQFSGFYLEWGHNKAVLIDEKAHGTIMCHETGHTYGFDDEKGDLKDIDGYQLRAGGARGTNKSIPEGCLLTSMMYWQPDEPTATWIRNPQYDSLLSATGAARSSTRASALLNGSGTPVLLVSGAIDENETVYLDPWRIQDFANMGPPTGSSYSIEFQDSSGTPVDTYSFDPSPPVMGTDGLEYRFFIFPVPLPEDTARVLIKAGSSVLAQVFRSDNAPSLTINSPSSGETWNGTKSVTWTGSDDDGDVLFYDVLYSHNGGADWIVLAVGQTATAYSFDTTAVSPGASAMVKVCASDGFNTTEQTVSLTVANGVVTTGVSPAPDEVGVSVSESIQIFFKNEMDANSLTASAFLLQNGSGDPVAGSLTYDLSSWRALFVPNSELIHETQYTASLAAGVADVQGNTLATDYTWIFTTEADDIPPSVAHTSPNMGALNVPTNSLVAVFFDEDMNAGSINTLTFTLSGGVNGTVTYDEDSRAAIFRPLTELAPGTIYTATLSTGIQDAVGNPLADDYTWSFTTGSDTSAGLRFAGVYVDRAVDDDGDGLYDRLIVDVVVEVLSSGTYNLNGKLDDSSGETIEWATTGGISLSDGVHALPLIFPSGVIRSHGIDGPFTLTALHLYDTADTSLYASLTNAYRTYPYDVTQFYAVLTLTGLPDITLTAGESLDNAFNLNDYARHETLADSELVYVIDINTDPGCGVNIDSDNNVDINPEADWVGSSDITIKVSGGSEEARDVFRVTVREILPGGSGEGEGSGGGCFVGSAGSGSGW